LKTEKEARTQTDTVFSITTAPQVNENETTGGGSEIPKINQLTCPSLMILIFNIITITGENWLPMVYYINKRKTG
jgi:hypothetical protein